MGDVALNAFSSTVNDAAKETSCCLLIVEPGLLRTNITIKD